MMLQGTRVALAQIFLEAWARTREAIEREDAAHMVDANTQSRHSPFPHAVFSSLMGGLPLGSLASTRESTVAWRRSMIMVRPVFTVASTLVRPLMSCRSNSQRAACARRRR